MLDLFLNILTVIHLSLKNITISIVVMWTQLPVMRQIIIQCKNAKKFIFKGIDIFCMHINYKLLFI